MSFISSSIQPSCAGSPSSANAGARRVGVTKWMLPRPPMPPSATTTRSPSCVRSAMSSPVSFVLLEVLAHHRAHGHLEHEVLPRRAVHAAAFAVRAALGLEVVLEAVLDERGQARVGLDHHVAAVPAVAAVRPALRHVGLAAKRHATRAAVAALHMYAHFVDKHGGLLASRPAARPARGRGSAVV